MAKYTNSKLVEYTKLSPNNSGTRTHAIDRITPHCVVGQCTIETLGNIFYPSSRQASSNYGIGKDGKVGMFVPESKRSWCSSSSANDQRAVTIECASDASAPYAFNNTVYNKLIELCADICKRNGKTKLVWISDKTKALAYTPKSNEMQITVHRWFANKSCPGDWLIGKMNDLVSKVNAKLNPAPAVAEKTTTSSKTTAKKTIKASGYSTYGPAASFSRNYTVQSSDGWANMRDKADLDSKIMTAIPSGKKVRCWGYYSIKNAITWLYVVYVDGNTTYEGFVSKNLLK